MKVRIMLILAALLCSSLLFGGDVFEMYGDENGLVSKLNGGVVNLDDPLVKGIMDELEMTYMEIDEYHVYTECYEPGNDCYIKVRILEDMWYDNWMQ